MNIYSNSSHNHPKLETTQVSFNCWMDKQIVLYPCNGILLKNKKEQTTDMDRTWMSLKGIIQCEKSKIQKATYELHESVCMTYWKRQYYRDGNQKEIARGQGRGKGWLQCGIKKMGRAVEQYLGCNDCIHLRVTTVLCNSKGQFYCSF